MADPNAAPDIDPFAQLDSSAPLGATAKPSRAAPADPFANLDSSQPLGPSQASSATGAFTREAARGTLPALGSIPAMGAGAELGAALGLAGGPLAEITSPVGAFIGGGLGAIGGAAAVSKVQDYALKMLPDSWKDTLGLSERQQKIDEGEHPVASFLGGIAPYALTMRPGATPKVALPENATALQRIMTNPATARLFGGAAMGGMQLGQEAVSDEGEGVNWNRVAIATGFGLVFNRPTRFGERITELGARPARTLLGRPSPSVEAASPTLNQAADAKVAGAGITESVFQGVHAQDPAAEMTAQQNLRNEQAVMGTALRDAPELHASVRQMHPELFQQYDSLTASADVFRNWAAEATDPAEAAIVRNHLGYLQGKIDELSPEVHAAYRRAAEATSAATTERPGAPERFPSFAAMLAAQGEEGVPSSKAPATTEVQGIQPAATSGAPPPAGPGTQAEPGAVNINESPRTVDEQQAFIAQDVERQLIATGQPPDVARQGGLLAAKRYRDRAWRMGGKLGGPEDLYRREGADIRGVGPGKTGPATPSVPAPPLAPAEQAKAQNIDATKDVVSGANSSKDPNGPVYIDKRIPQESPTLKDDQGNPVNLWNSLQLHERVEADQMAAGKSYDEAHKDATAAERELARRTGYDWEAYTKEIDGYLAHIEKEKAENPPTNTHIDPEQAIGHHRSTNKPSGNAVRSTASEVGSHEGAAGEGHDQQSNEGIGASSSTQIARGPAARDEKTYSLLEFLARRGGIRNDDSNIADLQSSVGDNKFIPGFGTLIRKPAQLSTSAIRQGRYAPMRIDTAREAAIEAGYLPEDATINDLLEKVDQEARGDKQYRAGYIPENRPQGDEARSKAGQKFIKSLRATIEKEGGTLTAPEETRALDMWEHEGISDHEQIIERLALENDDKAIDHGHTSGQEPAGIPGWDDDTAATPGPGGLHGAVPEPGGAEIGGIAHAGSEAEREWVEFFQRRGKPGNQPDLITEREAEGQQQIPGADRISQAELVQRRANAPLKPGVAQKPADEGLFVDQTKQGELFQAKLPMDQESRMARAKELGFDTSKVWYHGARRSDRLTEKGKLLPKRATSGPMPFFTDDPALASSYSTAKADTSLEHPDDYAGWFKFKPQGARSTVDVARAWHFLDPETRRTVAERLPDIKQDDDGEGNITYKKGQGFPAGDLKAWNEYYLPREGRGNPLKAAVEVWLNSGILFNDEERFLDVLKLAGMKDVEFDSPHVEKPGVLATYMKIRNPLDTSNEEALKALLPDLRALASRSRRQSKPGADMWSKSATTPRMFLERFEEDLANGGTTHAWTSIPDEVTSLLASKGYDGILDTGGKGGGPTHNVMIPFRPDQVRSVNAKFDTEDASGKLLGQKGAQLGSIVLNPTKAPGRDYIGVPDVRPIMRIAAKGDPSTFIHESGHQYLGELMRDAEHEAAPDDLKADAKTVLDWLKVDDASAIKTKQHEKFARGFEQYLREGVAPSPELATVFGKFRDWLLRIYQTLRGLGSEITPEIRGVFDRLLASEPQRTVIAPERIASPTLADVHETDAATTEPHEAEPAMDRVLKEAEQFTSNLPAGITNEHANSTTAAAELAAENGLRPADEGQVDPHGGGPQPVNGGGPDGKATGAELRGGGNAGGEGAGQPAGGERSGEPSPTDAGLGDKPLAPRPRQQFGAAESPFLDKAGNIRVENLTTREDVAQALRDAANENNDFIGDRRGVVTDGQIEGLAEDIGMAGAEDLVKQRILGQAFNAEQVVALRKLLVQSATDVSAAMKKAATGTDEDVIAYAMAKDRHQMIQATVSQATAEAGRALRAFRNIAGMTQEAQQADMFIREATGKTLFQLRREARLGAELKTPQQVSQFMLDSQNKNFGRMVMEYWINGLISGPVTHMTYGIGNEILTLQKAIPETAAAAAIGNIRRALGREGDTVRMGEVGQKLRAHGAAFAPAAKAFFDALKTGQTVQLPGERIAQNVLQFPGAGIVEPALYDESAKFSDVMASAFSVMRGIRDGMIAGGDIAAAGGAERPFLGLRPSLQGAIPDVEIGSFNLPVGNIVRLPSRFVAAIHSFFRGVNFSMEKAGDSFRTATNEGLTGTAFDQRVAEMRARPSQAKMEQYGLASSETTLMGQGGAFTKAISNLFNTPFFATKDATGKAISGTGFPFLKFIDPFVHISSNIIQQSLVERTPLGVLSPTIRADLMGRNGTIAQDTAMARMLVGTAYAIGLGGLAAEGYVSGSEPADPRQAAIWRQAGNQAHSVKVGDIWYDVHRLGPLGMLLGISADLYDVSHLAEQGDILNAASHLQHAITQNILDESFMRGPSDLIRAVEDPGRYGESYIKNFLSGFVPYSVGMSQIARATDPYSRQARTVMDSIRAKVPGLSESLLPRRDIWGQELPNKDALIGAGVTAIYEQRVSRDPVNLALLDLGIYPAQLERKVRNVQLTDQQYDDFQRIAGRMTKINLDRIVNSPDYRSWPNQLRHDVIAQEITASREAARGMLMMKFPQIARDAAQRKLDRVNGARP
jgi:hypothetical protein